jgi:hypothetical protein
MKKYIGAQARRRNIRIHKPCNNKYAAMKWQCPPLLGFYFGFALSVYLGRSLTSFLPR